MSIQCFFFLPVTNENDLIQSDYGKNNGGKQIYIVLLVIKNKYMLQVDNFFTSYLYHLAGYLNISFFHTIF